MLCAGWQVIGIVCLLGGGVHTADTDGTRRHGCNRVWGLGFRVITRWPMRCAAGALFVSAAVCRLLVVTRMAQSVFCH